MENIVIVGNGQAGIQLADSLRTEGWTGRITLLGDEDCAPYQRPPLSKDYLESGKDPQPLPLRAPRFFAENDIDHRLGVRVTSVDRGAQTVALDDGSQLAYSTLVLATGATNRSLSVPGSDLGGIHGLRTLDEANAVHARLGSVRSAVVVGAGFIGLEFAAAARARGVEVTVLGYTSRPMGRALSPTMSAFFSNAHALAGVSLRPGEDVASFEGEDGRVTAAISTAGARYPAELVLVGIGVLPRIELAESDGLAVDNGVVVDASMRTSDPNIFAIGDCASFPRTDARIRIESVQNATDQARHAAKAILGNADPYRELPWFWSQQGKLKLQIAGLVAPGDHTVVRGDPTADKFSIFCFRGGELRAVESVNQPADHMAARRLLGQGRSLTPEQAADPGFDFKAYSKTTTLLAPAATH